MKPPIVKVFVSSTWLDLQPERAAVEAALQRLRETKFTGMEYFGSRDETTRGASLDEVDRSDVYVGLFAGRYGSGITEDEYRRARQRDLTCFIFFKEDGTIPAQWREADAAQADKLAALRKDLRRQHTISEFRNPDDLAARLTADLHRWLVEQFLEPRLAQGARGEVPRPETERLLAAVKDLASLDQQLLIKLRNKGFAIVQTGSGAVAVGQGAMAAGERGVAIGGNVSGSTIITGDGSAVR